VNSAGIYAIRLFIRGKPWIVTLDDTILYDTEKDRPVFS